mmetsp:Transcript_17541/g.37924  ORF Transcript_17541/g.37924 Transcript_17541/m.37924 type:complete len:408 (+) Transcript_17541:18-1241(+)
MIRAPLVLLTIALYFFGSCCHVADAFSNSKRSPALAGATNRIGRVHSCNNAALHATRRKHPSAKNNGTGEKITSSEDNTPTVTHENHYLSRRRWLRTTASAASAVLALSPPQSALAAPPLTAEAADGFSARVERSLRPKPAKVLRPRMNLDFAVLLMRSSYNAVDELDVVAMDQFQRDFFLIRQAEYKPYADSLGAGAMVQGDLADPNYFDFISFAQYATIAREMADPATLFEEQQPVEVRDGGPQRFEKVVVKRDPSLLNGDLARRHAELVGDAILDKLIEKFGETAAALPRMERGSRPKADTLLASVKQMVNLFVISGFAWDGNASMLKSNERNAAGGVQFSITFTSPATLWSGQSLKMKKGDALLMNDFALKTVRVMMSRAGYSVVNASVKYANNQEITTFTVV